VATTLPPAAISHSHQGALPMSTPALLLPVPLKWLLPHISSSSSSSNNSHSNLSSMTLPSTTSSNSNSNSNRGSITGAAGDIHLSSSSSLRLSQCSKASLISTEFPPEISIRRPRLPLSSPPQLGEATNPHLRGAAMVPTTRCQLLGTRSRELTIPPIPTSDTGWSQRRENLSSPVHCLCNAIVVFTVN